MAIDRSGIDVIRNASFPSAWAWRGYDKVEVEKFLDELAGWLESEDSGGPVGGGATAAVADLEAKIEQLEQEMGKARRRERRLVEELKLARAKLRSRASRKAVSSTGAKGGRTTGSTRAVRRRTSTASTRAARKPAADAARPSRKQATGSSRAVRTQTTGSTRAVRKQPTGSRRAVRKQTTGSTKALKKRRSTGSTRAVAKPGSARRKRTASVAAPGRRKGALDVNRVDFDELRGIGLSITQAALLIALRDTRGGFKSLDELEDVQGLTKESADKLRARLYVGATGSSSG